MVISNTVLCDVPTERILRVGVEPAT